ncbi:hypothetical protein B0T24DRAFT_82574 [Lasiosphaeria ovina]|uniref:Uncharacterized protein n=1 Tax=Lasiosphaeria ovina TaxID=92902 RepID=A0AAE0TYR8_9PEZI|nr:hypothetical protein B0T24DRAFT_82574 [Lasiosphaeria ovina]
MRNAHQGSKPRIMRGPTEKSVAFSDIPTGMRIRRRAYQRISTYLIHERFRFVYIMSACPLGCGKATATKPPFVGTWGGWSRVLVRKTPPRLGCWATPESRVRPNCPSACLCDLVGDQLRSLIFVTIVLHGIPPPCFFVGWLVGLLVGKRSNHESAKPACPCRYVELGAWRFGGALSSVQSNGLVAERAGPRTCCLHKSSFVVSFSSACKP